MKIVPVKSLIGKTLIPLMTTVAINVQQVHAQQMNKEDIPREELLSIYNCIEASNAFNSRLSNDFTMKNFHEKRDKIFEKQRLFNNRIWDIRLGRITCENPETEMITLTDSMNYYKTKLDSLEMEANIKEGEILFQNLEQMKKYSDENKGNVSEKFKKVFSESTDLYEKHRYDFILNKK